MTTLLTSPAPAVLVRPRAKARTLAQKRLRRVQVVWALLFFNVLTFATQPLVLNIPHFLGQGLTQGSLVLAFVLALTVNPKVKVRPNLFLGLYSLLAITTLMMSVRFVGLGTTYRASRVVVFLAVLWLVTPWFGRRDLLLVRTQVRILAALVLSVLVGLALSPSKAYVLNAGARRLTGAIWPMEPTAVGHYAAELTGLALLLWLCGIWGRRLALAVAVPSALALVLTHTRTAMGALIVALLVAGLSMASVSRRVRALLATALVVGAIVSVPLSPFISSWLQRGQTSAAVTELSGRTEVWPVVLSEPRPVTDLVLGSGLSNDSVVGAANPAFNGLPIDNGWISTFQNQGVVGDMLEGACFLGLLLVALLRPRGPTRALALFLIVYCLASSFTETVVGGASTYLLDLTLAASLLVGPLPAAGPGGSVARA